MSRSRSSRIPWPDSVSPPSASTDESNDRLHSFVLDNSDVQMNNLQMMWFFALSCCCKFVFEQLSKSLGGFWLAGAMIHGLWQCRLGHDSV